MTEKRGRGRPEIGPEVRGLRLDPGTLAEVEALAASRGVLRAEVLRELVAEGLRAEARRAKRRERP